MLPLADQRVRHRRPLTTAQQLRRSLLLLAVIAAVAAIGVSGKRPGLSQSPSADWAAIAIPFGAFFVLVSPTRSRVIRLVAVLALLAGLLAVPGAESPAGMVTLAGILIWAVVGVLAFALARPADQPAVLTKFRASAAWAGPLILLTALLGTLVAQ